MQLQMEVCDLDVCDFLECVFKEYSNYNEFENDTDIYEGKFNRNNQGNLKGIIAMFSGDSGPFYQYCPINTETTLDYDKWMNSVMERNNDKLFIKYIYWYLDTYSCIIVPRNKKWFQDNLNAFRTAWETIQQEKITGFEHRMPTKKLPSKKKSAKNTTIISISTNIDHLDEEGSID